MLGFRDLVAGMRLSGVVTDGDVTVVAVNVHGAGSATVTYRTGDGRLSERIVFVDDLSRLSEVSERRWSFDADGASDVGPTRWRQQPSRPCGRLRSTRPSGGGWR